MAGAGDVTFHTGGLAEFNSLRSALLKQKDDLKSALASGFAKNYDDYRYRVGEIKGIENALVMIDSAERNLR